MSLDIKVVNFINDSMSYADRIQECLTCATHYVDRIRFLMAASQNVNSDSEIEMCLLNIEANISRALMYLESVDDDNKISE